MASWLLLPGMDGSGELYAPLVRAISNSSQHANDPIAVARYSPRLPMNYAQLLPVVAAQMPAGKFTVVAESFSGPLAIALAAKCPERVERVVLSCTFVANPYPWLAAFTAFVPWMPLLPTPLTAFFGAEMLFNQYNSQTNRDLLQRALSSLTTEVMRARQQAVLTCDVRESAKCCYQPMLYLQAQEDRVIPPAAADALLAVRPTTKLVKLPGPHCLLQTRADQAWREIAAFHAATPIG